jgi:hypothetical protein
MIRGLPLPLIGTQIQLTVLYKVEACLPNGLVQLPDAPLISNNKRGVQFYGWDFLPNIQRPWHQYFILREGRRRVIKKSQEVHINRAVPSLPLPSLTRHWTHKIYETDGQPHSLPNSTQIWLILANTWQTCTIFIHDAKEGYLTTFNIDVY